MSWPKIETSGILPSIYKTRRWYTPTTSPPIYLITNLITTTMYHKTWATIEKEKHYAAELKHKLFMLNLGLLVIVFSFLHHIINL